MANEQKMREVLDLAVVTLNRLTDLTSHDDLIYETLDAIGKALAQQPAAVPDYQGWYCAHCQRGVDASEVTFHEQHTVCGRKITDDRPPAAVVELTDAEILGLALEGFCISTQYGQSERKLMPISDSATLKDFARAVIAANEAKQGGAA